MTPSNGMLPPEALRPIAKGRLATKPAAAWNAMNVQARKLGCELLPTGSMSSYRSYSQQQLLWQLYLKGGNLAARPGTSNHGWGTAVDLATPQMRAMVDRIGAHFGWSKTWSNAQSEWWHIVYQPGHWAGLDPGPQGRRSKPKKPAKKAKKAA